MKPDMIEVSSMTPHCSALRDYWTGEQQNPPRIIRSDGYPDVIPVGRFFSEGMDEGDKLAPHRLFI